MTTSLLTKDALSKLPADLREHICLLYTSRCV